VAFRQAAIAQDVSVAAYLGRLVEAELGRRGRRRPTTITPQADEADEALVALADVRASIDELDHIAGRLARSASAHGASWTDVGSSLRLSGDDARRAYDRPS
jgi:hypothetical protein